MRVCSRVLHFETGFELQNLRLLRMARIIVRKKVLRAGNSALAMLCKASRSSKDLGFWGRVRGFGV